MKVRDVVVTRSVADIFRVFNFSGAVQLMLVKVSKWFCHGL